MLSEYTSSPKDYSDIENLLSRCYNALYPSYYPADVLGVALPLLVRPKPELLANGQYFYIRDAGKMIACGGWSEADPGTGLIDQNRAHVRQFATHPEHLRKGAASLVIASCIRDAKRAGVSILDCLSSLAAVSFYVRVGFEVIEQDTIMLNGKLPFDVVRMEKNL